MSSQIEAPPTADSVLPDMMEASPARIATLLSNHAAVISRVSSASQKASLSKPVRLVAVSKLKPVSDIVALHSPPVTHFPGAQVHFAENYFQELLEKSRLLPPSIKWHFVGGLQSNKCVSLARDVRGLWAVESVDTEKKASLLDRGWSQRSLDSNITVEAAHTGTNTTELVDGEEEEEEEEDDDEKLRVFVQVNTSGEENKSGVDIEKAVELCRFIRSSCPRLKLQGLMTIGAIARSKAATADDPNEDFVRLREMREHITLELGMESPDELELSMGMSQDFEGAIALGSNEVRIGTTIFGERPPRSEATIT